MRLKVVVPMLLAAIALLALILFKQKPHVTESTPSTATETTSATQTVAAAASVAPMPTVTTTVATNNPPALSAEAHADYIEKRSDELMDLAMEDDAAAHQQVVDELKNSDPAIRKAARNALKQVNDRSIIPQIQQIADQTADPDEKQAIEDVIDFMQLPTPVEYLKQHPAGNAAQTNSPQQ